MVAAGAAIPPGTKTPPNSQVRVTSDKVKRSLTDEDRRLTKISE
jgi:hypothetical protein